MPAPSTTRSTPPGGAAVAALPAICALFLGAAAERAGARAVGEFAAAGVPAAVLPAFGGGLDAASSVTCTVAISAPADTESPFLMSIELITPRTGDGTSMEAFSDSSVISG